MDKKTAALIALVMASAGGTAWLSHHHNPTLREVFSACEKGDLTGTVCCEDTLHAKDILAADDSCGMIKPGIPDPLGLRKKLQDDWDKQR